MAASGQDKTAVSVAESACGPRSVGFKVDADKSQHPTPSPGDGKALIYVIQKDDASTRVGADGKWLGALRRRTYLVASVDPGEQHLCAIGRIGVWSHVSLHELNAKAGETYYFVTEYGQLIPDQFALHQWTRIREVSLSPGRTLARSVPGDRLGVAPLLFAPSVRLRHLFTTFDLSCRAAHRLARCCVTAFVTDVRTVRCGRHAFRRVVSGCAGRSDTGVDPTRVHYEHQSVLHFGQKMSRIRGRLFYLGATDFKHDNV